MVGHADLAQEALDKSLEIREEAGLPFGTPLNVFDLCELLRSKVRVRFADYSMEGCYSRSEQPLIEVSALRPLTEPSTGNVECDERLGGLLKHYYRKAT